MNHANGDDLLLNESESENVIWNEIVGDVDEENAKLVNGDEKNEQNEKWMGDDHELASCGRQDDDMLRPDKHHEICALQDEQYQRR